VKARPAHSTVLPAVSAAVFIVLSLAVSGLGLASAADDAARLVGSWKLVSWQTKHTDGSTDYPMGESPAGLLIYDARGNMSLQIMDDFRPAFSQGYDKTTLDELKEVYKTYAAMFGHYSVDPSARTVSIEVQGITNPNYMSSTLTRYYTLKGNTLVMAFDPKGMNSTTWKRIQ
jgi:hypothetical protein